MRIEELTRYTPFVYTGDDGRPSPKMAPHDAGEAVLLKDLPQKILVSEKKPRPGFPVHGYFEDAMLDGMLVRYNAVFDLWDSVVARTKVPVPIFWRDLLY